MIGHSAPANQRASLTSACSKVQTVILAGGKGLRLHGEMLNTPKPLVPIGERPLLLHVMDQFYDYGCTDFLVVTGYNGSMIKDYLWRYCLCSSNLKLDLRRRRVECLDEIEPWTITVVDTGLEAESAARLKRIRNYVQHGPFLLAYADVLANVNIEELLAFHTQQKTLVTMTVVRKPSQYGIATLDTTKVRSFSEKGIEQDNWINAGIFALDAAIFDAIPEESLSFERDVLPLLAQRSAVSAYRHKGFWQSIETLKDRELLEQVLSAHKDETEPLPWRRR